MQLQKFKSRCYPRIFEIKFRKAASRLLFETKCNYHRSLVEIPRDTEPFLPRLNSCIHSRQFTYSFPLLTATLVPKATARYLSVAICGLAREIEERSCRIK